MSSIKQLYITYDLVNNSNACTNGDVINGRVFLEVNKEVTIESLYVKFKGDANVRWSETRNNETYHYHAHERYFKFKQYIIQDPAKKGREDPGTILICGETYSTVVKPGSHVYPFSFQLPQGNFPPTVVGHHGSVKYILEVTLDRSWKRDLTDKKEIIFVPNVFGGHLMNPQSGSVDKKMKLFTSGRTTVRSTIDKMGYMPGHAIKVSTEIDNASSRNLKLKYSLEQKQSFYAQGHRKHSHHTVFKIVGDPIPSGSKQTINTDLTLPPTLEMSVTNCNILKLEYIFKVYLDVPLASDPEIKFPVFILPLGQVCIPGQNQPPLQPYGIPGGSGWNQPPPQPEFGPGPPGAPFGPAPGIYPGPYPTPAGQNPEAPPSYSSLYPLANSTAAGFNPTPSDPTFNPQYPPMGYPNPPFPQQYPVPAAPQFNPGPAGPGYVPAGAAPGYWPIPTTQPESYPVKSPEKHE